MTVEISAEDHHQLEEAVLSGRFSSVAEALHEGVQSLRHSSAADEKYRDYVRERIEAGIADIEAGRVVPAERVFERLTSLLSKRKFSLPSVPNVIWRILPLICYRMPLTRRFDSVMNCERL